MMRQSIPVDPHELGSSAENASKAKLLAVDDQEGNLLALEALLLDLNVDIVKARSGPESLKCVLEAEFALIVMDVHMPGMDGFETAALIRQRDKTRHVPIIFLTADALTDAYLFKGYSLGAVDFLYKPIVPEILRSKVCAFIDLYEKSAEIKRQTELLRVELEAQVQLRTAQLQVANQTLQSLIDASPQAIVAMDLDSRIQSWNKAAERTFRWTAQEVLGKPLPFVLVVEREHRDLFQRVLHGEVVTNVPVQQQRHDGSLIDLLVSISLVDDSSGTHSGYLVVASDVTEQRKLERQLFRAQRLESVGTLASGIAHDLNNILTPILMSIDLLRDHVKDASKQNTLATLELSALRGATLVKQVLTFARGLEGERMPVQVGHLLRDVEKIVGSTFPKSIRITSRVCARDLRPVLADATQLHQVFMNLCVNARDAMPRGGTLSISARDIVLDETYAGLHTAAKPGPYILIEVADSGIGIPADIIEKIFEPFFTTKEPGKGTGLGLSTVDAIVKNHSGFVTVYSEVGTGTSFNVYLPSLASSKEERPQDGRRELPCGHGELILIVDDEAAMRDITRVTLENYGYRVVTAANGAEGVALFAKQTSEIGAVISDMNMPVMDGSAMIQALRTIDPTVRVLSTSGLPHSGGGMKPNSEVGVTAFLSKPYTAEQLLQALAEVLKR